MSLLLFKIESFNCTKDFKAQSILIQNSLKNLILCRARKAGTALNEN